MARCRARLLGAGNFSIKPQCRQRAVAEFRAFDAASSSIIRGTVVLEFNQGST